MELTCLRVGLALLRQGVAPENDLARLRVEPPAVVVRVVLERLHEVAEIDAPQIEQAISFLSPAHCTAGSVGAPGIEPGTSRV